MAIESMAKICPGNLMSPNKFSSVFGFQFCFESFRFGF
jgi:hypothetical protein